MVQVRRQLLYFKNGGMPDEATQDFTTLQIKNADNGTVIENTRKLYMQVITNFVD